MGLSPGQLPRRGIARLHVSAFVTMTDLIIIPTGLLPTNTPTSNPWEGLFPMPLPTQLTFIFNHWQSDRKNQTMHFRPSCLCFRRSLCFTHPSPSDKWSSIYSVLPKGRSLCEDTYSSHKHMKYSHSTWSFRLYSPSTLLVWVSLSLTFF